MTSADTRALATGLVLCSYVAASRYNLRATWLMARWAVTLGGPYVVMESMPLARAFLMWSYHQAQIRSRLGLER